MAPRFKSVQLVDRMLTAIELDVLPMMRDGVRSGNKIFGAAVLAKSTLELVVAESNQETRNPLFHAEVTCLNRYWALADEARPMPRDCLFLSTHEPCSLCLSAITWSGFDNFYYLFSYEDTRDEFEIPHDLNILEQVFGCRDGAYARKNAYWTSYHLVDLIGKANEAERIAWSERVETLRAQFRELSHIYQAQERRGAIHFE